jgi:hypothetical protein
MFRVFGTTDEGTGCECCGRPDLKVYVVMEDEAGSIGRYGTTCAAKLRRVPAATIRTEAKDADRTARRQREAVAAAARREEADRFAAFLTSTTGESDTFTAIEALGGYTAARTAYEEVAA